MHACECAVIQLCAGDALWEQICARSGLHTVGTYRFPKPRHRKCLCTKDAASIVLMDHESWLTAHHGATPKLACATLQLPTAQNGLRLLSTVLRRPSPSHILLHNEKHHICALSLAAPVLGFPSRKGVELVLEASFGRLQRVSCLMSFATPAPVPVQQRRNDRYMDPNHACTRSVRHEGISSKSAV